MVDELPGRHQGALGQGLLPCGDGWVAHGQRSATGAAQACKDRLQAKACVKAQAVAEADVEGAGPQQRQGPSQRQWSAHAHGLQGSILLEGGALQQRMQQRILVAQVEAHHAV